MNTWLVIIAIAAIVAAVFAVVRARAATESIRGAARRKVEEVRAELRAGEDARNRLEAELQQREANTRKALGRLESQIKELESTIGNERALRAQVEKGRETERRWSRELRAQFSQLSGPRRPLSDNSDIPSLVLHTAVTLLGADKGLLLSRSDGDGDGKLDLEASEGFAHDPSQSAIAQRFATEVLERDQTVRESRPSEIKAQADEPSDEEIENLVAIPIFIQDTLSGVVVGANKPGGFDDSDDDVLLALGDHAGAVLENAKLQGDLRNSYLTTVTMLAEALEAKDPFLRGHSEEITAYVNALADRFRVDSDRREQLVFAAMLRDTGKIGISERILLKPAPLTREERSIVELHPRIGYRLLQQVPVLEDAAHWVLHHHERYAGDGYPAHLAGEAIPVEARILAVIDAFSAMVSDRPYRTRMSAEQACAELERGAGTQFDPEVARAFVEEIKGRGLASVTKSALASAMADPELNLRRGDDEPILGYGPVGVTDNLTLLYSHRYFHDDVAAEAHRAALQDSPFAVVMAEITSLGDINRNQGYAAGDAAIQKVAHVIQGLGAARDGTPCRYSGRMLALLLPHADEIEGKRCAAELEAALYGDPQVRTGSSAWRPGDTGELVIARAIGTASAGPQSKTASGAEGAPLQAPSGVTSRHGTGP